MGCRGLGSPKLADALEDCLGLLEDDAVFEAQGGDAEAVEEVLVAAVVSVADIAVIVAVKFDGETEFGAVEVEDTLSHTELAAESESVYLTVLQVAPEAPFGFGAVGAEFAAGGF